MNAIESPELSQDTEQSSDNAKFVPVAESIRYRKRAQSAEKQVEDLNEQLTQAKSQEVKLTEQLNEIRLEQSLARKLAEAGAVDLETAILITKNRLQSDNTLHHTVQGDLDVAIEQLKKEKQYLFRLKDGEVQTAKKTAGARERIHNAQTALDKAARKAATTGSRADLQEYLKLRRNYL